MAGRRFPSSAVGRDCRKPQCGEGGLCFVKDPRENYRTRWTMNKDESFLGYVCIKYVSSINRPSNEILREKIVNLAAPFWPLPHWRFLTHFPSDFALESTTVSSLVCCISFICTGPSLLEVLVSDDPACTRAHTVDTLEKHGKMTKLLLL